MGKRERPAERETKAETVSLLPPKRAAFVRVGASSTPIALAEGESLVLIRCPAGFDLARLANASLPISVLASGAGSSLRLGDGASLRAAAAAGDVGTGSLRVAAVRRAGGDEAEGGVDAVTTVLAAAPLLTLTLACSSGSALVPLQPVSLIARAPVQQLPAAALSYRLRATGSGGTAAAAPAGEGTELATALTGKRRTRGQARTVAS